jgi:glutaredoxin
MSSIVIYSLNGCGYSSSSVGILEKRGVKAKIYNIEWEQKEDIKKENKMSTFPQIFLEYNKKTFKIGGNSDLKNIIAIIDKTKNTGNFNEMVDEIDSLIKGDRRVALEVIYHLK